MSAKGMKSQPTTRNVPALTVRSHLGQSLDRVARNRERFVVTKKGEARAVILSIEDYLQAVVKTPASMAILQAQAKRRGADKLTLEEIETEIEAVRQAKAQQKA